MQETQARQARACSKFSGYDCRKNHTSELGEKEACSLSGSLQPSTALTSFRESSAAARATWQTLNANQKYK